MSRNTFDSLVNEICGHEVFQQRNIKHQKPIGLQLAVTLKRLGSNTNIRDIASMFGIADGTVMKYQERVITALKSLKGKYVVWPRGEYCRMVHDQFQEVSGFPNVIGTIDGSHIPLWEAPSNKNKDVYYSRKQRYGIHLQGVVDHDGLFTTYNVGWPASVHDAKVFKNSSVVKMRSQFFIEQDYLLVDGAYPLSEFTITPF
ncbi:629_t:CDS:1 [Paraglomus occultum]|uniref:629_t:CDS:1 n=1 Tax=Paraglomus occultum TaxID=144539 RepID=A0A9N9CXQ5_9GLOM|nr:629_t:CDS:1 [Paraglomus occultum]